MGPDPEGPVEPPAPHPVIATVTAALNREYRVPFVTVVTVVALSGLAVMLFLYAYGHAVVWVRDQVRAERAVIDIQRDHDKANQDAQLANHEARLASLERRSGAVDTSLAALTVEVRGMRDEIASLSRAMREDITTRRAR